MTFRAEVDEGRFQTGFDASDLASIDVGFLLLPGTGFDVQVVKALSIDERDAQLFGLCRVDEHSFHTVSLIERAGGRRAAIGDDEPLAVVLCSRTWVERPGRANKRGVCQNEFNV